MGGVVSGGNPDCGGAARSAHRAQPRSFRGAAPQPAADTPPLPSARRCGWRGSTGGGRAAPPGCGCSGSASFLPEYADIKVEIVIDYGLTDIVAERCDAPVRLGEQVARDMIAVRIGPDVRFVLVGTKSYFARRPPPRTPQELVGHNCINLRFPSYGSLYAWEFAKGAFQV
jgi:hypothetical protein